MRRRIRTFLGSSGLIVSGAAVAASVVWHRATRRAVTRLRASAGSLAPAFYSVNDLQHLPEPVARYFRFALTPGQRITTHATIRHVGRFQTAPDKPAVPFTSIQQVSTIPPGFVWDARIKLVPIAGVRVRDSYFRGTGSMLARIGGIIPVANQIGTAEIAISSLQRYLAELPWVPTALLPGHGLHWTPLDDRSARATLSDSGFSVSVDFHFEVGGAIERVSAMRYRDVDGRPVLTPFEGRHFDYQRRDGMMIPISGEVSWTLPEALLTFWRGRITDIEYT